MKINKGVRSQKDHEFLTFFGYNKTTDTFKQSIYGHEILFNLLLIYISCMNQTGDLSPLLIIKLNFLFFFFN